MSKNGCKNDPKKLLEVVENAIDILNLQAQLAEPPD